MTEMLFAMKSTSHPAAINPAGEILAVVSQLIDGDVHQDLYWYDLLFKPGAALQAVRTVAQDTRTFEGQSRRCYVGHSRCRVPPGRGWPLRAVPDASGENSWGPTVTMAKLWI